MQPLVQAALSEIWSTPDSSNQVILQLPRLTPAGGVLGTYNVLRDSYTLPNQTSFFHLYMIGGRHPNLVNLFDVRGSWELLSDACNQICMVANLYNSVGIEVPRTRAWYFLNTDDNNIVLAVEINLNLPVSWDTDTLYLRTYRNPYFANPLYSSIAKLHVGGGLMTSIAMIAALQTEIAAIQQSNTYTGGLYFFVNGRKVGAITSLNTVIGSVAEYVYDSSIYRAVDFHISSLPSFLSIMDNKTKYLLHASSVGVTAWDGQIDYQDNIDMYLINASTQVGCYVHKNAADTLRQVSFRDYSVATEYLQAYYNSFSDVNGNLVIANLYLRLHIRYDGVPQYPTEDANRLHYLLQLSDTQQQAALVGQNANINAWNAASLEQSAYTQLMRATRQNVTLALAEGAYGYSVANLRLAPNLQVPALNNGTLQVTVPIAFSQAAYAATCYEYDVNGLLLGYYPVSAGTAIYTCANPTAKLCEFIEGTLTVTLDEVYGENPTITTAGNNYRCYMKTIVNGVTAANWTDVTGTNAYTNTGGVITWPAAGNPNRLVRSDKTFLGYAVVLNPTDGVLQHTLKYKLNGGNGSLVNVTIPLGELDVWLNGHALVPGIDFFYTFPTITVVSKAYLNSAPGPQTLTVRYTGFCKPDLSSQKVEETGFVWNGVVGIDHARTVHFSKSERVIVGGRTLTPGTVPYLENVASGNLTNGQPYAIREYLNPLNGLIDQEPYAYYAVDLATDVVVSAYLTLQLGNPATSPLNPITQKYHLYSPFICKILYALLNGNITSSQVAGTYTDETVRTLCSPYTYLLSSDPVTVQNTPDTRYVIIDPHWLTTVVSVTADSYRFLNNVVRIYSNGLVTLSASLSISS